jgi:5-methylthioadenosine/S-adenosylhomocysteine deaminase
VAYLESLGVLEARPLLIHAVTVDTEDLRRIQMSGSSVAHCARSNARFCHGTAPLAELLSSGIRVGLGTDGVVSTNACDLFEEARFAGLLQRSRTDAEKIPLDALEARGLLRLLTLGGAEALGLGEQIGSLEPGKLADIVAVALSGPHHVPVHDPEVSLVFSARPQDVLLTMVEGRVLYREGKVSTLEEDALRAEVERVAAKLTRS